MEQEEIHLTKVEQFLDKDINVPNSDDANVLHNHRAFAIAEEYLAVIQNAQLIINLHTMMMGYNAFAQKILYISLLGPNSMAIDGSIPIKVIETLCHCFCINHDFYFNKNRQHANNINYKTKFNPRKGILLLYRKSIGSETRDNREVGVKDED
ncbi:hypothetical protein HETIRDRAFT_424463 [Heterobasidion irregulare TC 32-1]|uniref:Uncharacterized protein n=1 Tax=Heterobasidion irregulare (strain TC 32-1) TaxID=747525 RepID=W4KRX9_HETIT|nr:uncharacterized protein HETIRDRAFT_424463 [Heterobasidion irregulare TC 32-1]ETW87806.1 hypothetical protein HETIRDRAFT_424463 [Heterobasidion irregulare TC 32-1]